MGNFEKVVNAARDFACTLYKNKPGEIIPNALDDGLYAAWDKLCGEPPKSPPDLPLPPATPFVGGQCCDVVYNVAGTFTSTSGTTPWSLDLKRGSIIGLEGIRQTTLSDSFWLIRKRCNGTIERDLVASGARPVSCKITSVVRVDGKPDNCGNPPKRYPDTSPAPPEGYTSPPTPIVINNNETINYVFNLKPPTRSGNPLNLLPPIKVDINNPTLNLTVPLEFNFNGDINIGTPGGGGGFTETDRNNLNDIKNKNDNINTTTNNTNITLNQVVTNINTEINNGRNRKRPDGDFLPSPPPKPPGKHDQEYLEAVEVKLLSVPRNAKKQSGGASPDVVYAGWFEFTRKGKALPRDPIHFEGSVFKAPEGADGFAYTLYTGYTGEATPIINKAVT
ncbi:MAG: hypothetical protein ACRCYQ_01330 [Nocardioides sp.]